MEDAKPVQLFLELGSDPADLLQIVGFAVRRFQRPRTLAFERCLVDRCRVQPFVSSGFVSFVSVRRRRLVAFEPMGARPA